MSDWAGQVHATLSNYIKGEENNTLRNRKVLAMLKSKGRISFNWSGLDMVWRIRYAQGQMQGYADGETLTFPRRNRRQTATLPWRGYAMSESLNKLDKLKNRGREAIVNFYATLGEDMMKDMGEVFGPQVYVDGEAAGNGRKIHGIESYMGSSGVTRPFVADPSDTYAGLSTALAAYGGSWTGTWPNGEGDAKFDFFSPILVNYTGPDVGGVGWKSNTKTWEHTCIEALRFGILYAMRSKSNKGMLDTIILDRELYRQFLERLDERTRITVQSNASNSTLIKLGFSDVQNFDGVDITTEFGIPSGVGYGFNFDEMEMRSMQSQMFNVEGPDWDIATRSWRTAIDFLGNMTSSPRSALKFAAFS